MAIVFNALAFQIAWFACVLGAVNGTPWTGPAVTLIVIAIHLARANIRLAELKLIAASGLIGLIGEAALMAIPAASYVAPSGINHVPPLWLISMWLGFATLLNVSFAWLKGRLVLAAVLGLLIGPLSYLAGERLGGIVIMEPRTLSLAAIAILWAIAYPLLVGLAQRWNGFRQ